MNKNRTKDFRMFCATIDCLTENKEKWEAIPAILQLKNQLEENIRLIKEFDKQKTGTSSIPVTSDKENLKTQLSDKTEVLYGAVSAYAEAGGLVDVLQKVKTIKYVSRMRETEIEPELGNFLVSVRELLPGLANYGVTEAMIVDAEELLARFVKLVGTPRNMIVKGSSVTKQMEVLMEDTLNLLSKQMDGLMVRFKSTDAMFFNAYTQARLVIDVATQHREKGVDTEQHG